MKEKNFLLPGEVALFNAIQELSGYGDGAVESVKTNQDGRSAEMMYYYWTRHGIRPSVFYGMPPGERLVIRAF